MNQSTAIGFRGEQTACDYLMQHGCRIIERNYRIQGGEIDIIAEDSKGYLLFVEVKTRKTSQKNLGYEAVTVRKKRLLIRAALRYLTDYPTDLQPRFDVAVVSGSDTEGWQVDYLKNAFDVSDCNIIF